MATRPNVCPPKDPDGFLFVRGELDLITGGDFFEMVDLSDFSLDVTTFSRLKYRLSGVSSAYVSQQDIGDSDGYINFLVLRVDFPEGTPTTKKYINWTYQGLKRPVGELMVLSGSRVQIIGGDDLGWKITSSDSSYIDGGILMENPHSDISVNVEILLAR